MYPQSVIFTTNKRFKSLTLFDRSGLYHRIKTPSNKIRITEVISFVIYRISNNKKVKKMSSKDKNEQIDRKRSFFEATKPIEVGKMGDSSGVVLM